MSSGTRLLIGFTLGVMLVVGAIVSLATGSWWFLILAVAVHAIGTLIVLATIGGRLRQEDKPDPVTDARLAEEPDDGERPHLAT
jgi:membrane protein implicated in regulation of membrane protease activity